MKPIRVVPVGGAEPRLLRAVATALTAELGAPCDIATQRVDPAFAHHPERNQYHSSAIIEHLAARNGTSRELLVGVTDVDLYIPILTFVFGEAQLGGAIAVVSYHRLTQEFYGLPRSESLLTERLVKEAIHEVGHTAGLTHCDDYECVMAASHAVEWLDLKGASLCEQCRGLMWRGLQPAEGVRAPR
jgi:archaemetzincin